MPKTKQRNLKSAIDTKTAVNAHQDSAIAGASNQSKRRKLVFTAVAAGLLLTVGVLGATITSLVSPRSAGNGENLSGTQSVSSSWLPKIFTVQPTAIPTPILEKQHIYAGGKLVAVETAGTQPTTSVTASDLVVWRKDNGSWYVRDAQNPTSPMLAMQFGANGDVPVPADFDGDMLADFCVFRPNYPPSGGTFFIMNNSTLAVQSIAWGTATDEPAPADFDGDGKADIAVWRASAATYYIVLSSSSTMQTIAVGQAGGTPFSADYDGDGLADAAAYKLNTVNNWYEWTIRRSSDNQTETIPWGDPPNGDKPVAGDFDGDGRFDVATRRDGTNQWVVRNVGTLSMNISGFAMQGTDKTVAGDYDGDGKTDAAVWRPSNGTWYIRQSSREGQADQMRVEQWGQSGDIPVPAPMKR